MERGEEEEEEENEGGKTSETARGRRKEKEVGSLDRAKNRCNDEYTSISRFARFAQPNPPRDERNLIYPLLSLRIDVGDVSCPMKKRKKKEETLR